jgi:hypothetical protein
VNLVSIVGAKWARYAAIESKGGLLPVVKIRDEYGKIARCARRRVHRL